MREHRPLASPIRFGVYEVDLVSEELRKNGLKIRLSGQPFQVLAMLLSGPVKLSLAKSCIRNSGQTEPLSISTTASIPP